MTAVSLENSQTVFPLRADPDMESARALPYKLRRLAGKAMPHERVAGCGRRLIANGATVVSRPDGSGHISGIETCGSGWLCAVCSRTIAEKRRIEVEKACTGHAKYGAAYMATFTVPHHAFDACKALVRGVAKAWRRVQAGRGWLAVKGAAGIVGTIRALEITHGRNGWHPHLHVLIFCDRLNAEAEAELRFSLFERWSNAVEAMDLGQCSPDAFEMHECHRAEEGGAYVAKWGADSEITKAGSKVARGANRSPWGLLLAGEAALFREYAQAIKGARRLTWSKGLKKRYAVEERTDEELTDETAQLLASEPVITLRPALWREVYKRNLVVGLLEVVERELLDIEKRRLAVLRYLSKHGLSLRPSSGYEYAGDECL